MKKMDSAVWQQFLAPLVKAKSGKSLSPVPIIKEWHFCNSNVDDNSYDKSLIKCQGLSHVPLWSPFFSLSPITFSSRWCSSSTRLYETVSLFGVLCRCVRTSLALLTKEKSRKVQSDHQKRKNEQEKGREEEKEYKASRPATEPRAHTPACMHKILIIS